MSSLRAPRESSVSGLKTAAAGGASDKRPWFGGLFRRVGSEPSGQSVAIPGASALLAFPSEAAPRQAAVPIADVATKPPPGPNRRSGMRVVRPMMIVAAIVVLFGLALVALRRFPLPQFTAAAPRTGNLTIDTRAVISEVLIDGDRRGSTPLTLSLAPGAHTIVVRSGSDERVVPLTIAAGADITQYFEMKAVVAAALVGRVSVATDPPGARVAVDGLPRGTSPLTVDGLTAEEHKIVVTSGAGSAERTVTIPAGGTASVMFSLPKTAGPVGGWLSISTPFDVEVVENEDVIGTSATTRIMLAAGYHNVVLTNSTLGFHEVRRIEVTAGKTMVIRVDPPTVSVSVNARPWAEILLDGKSVGQTPLGNLLVRVGGHEMVFRHPQFGERKQTVVVTVNGPNRIGMDLTK
jgi:PEGA domain-containing protein